MQKLCIGTECTILGTKVAKYPLYSIRFKMWFRSVLEHFANIEVLEHQFYSIRPKMMFGSVPNCFANLCL
jgi:hypothetical protein